MKYYKYIFVGIVISSVFFSCAKDQADPVPATGSCDSLKITYCYPVKEIIENNCINGCHEPNGSGNGDFTSFAGVKSKVTNGSFENRALVQKNMPLGGFLTTAQLQDLQTWVDNGSPE